MVGERRLYWPSRHCRRRAAIESSKTQRTVSGIALIRALVSAPRGCSCLSGSGTWGEWCSVHCDHDLAANPALLQPAVCLGDP